MIDVGIKKNIRVGLGQVNCIDAGTFRLARQIGLTSCQLNSPNIKGEKYWEYEDLLQVKKECAAFGIELEVIENVPRRFMDQILTGGPGRDEQIEYYCKTIRNLGKAEIPILGFHFMPNVTWRTSDKTRGRGEAYVTSYDQTLADQGVNIKPPLDPPLEHPDRREENVWKHYEYFITSVIPVAEEAGVKLALHADDPPVPLLGGSARIFYNTANIKRGMTIVDSDFLGLNFCLGTYSSMIGGAKNIVDIIREFGPSQKVFYVHFRDVQGTVPHFRECFLGEGNYRPAHMLKLLKDGGFNGLLFEDHVPEVENDTPWGHRARLHAIGYIQGLLEAIDSEETVPAFEEE